MQIRRFYCCHLYKAEGDAATVSAGAGSSMLFSRAPCLGEWLGPQIEWRRSKYGFSTIVGHSYYNGPRPGGTFCVSSSVGSSPTPCPEQWRALDAILPAFLIMVRSLSSLISSCARSVRSSQTTLSPQFAFNIFNNTVLILRISCKLFLQRFWNPMVDGWHT